MSEERSEQPCRIFWTVAQHADESISESGGMHVPYWNDIEEQVIDDCWKTVGLAEDLFLMSDVHSHLLPVEGVEGLSFSVQEDVCCGKK